VKELASISIRAESNLMKLKACLGLEICRQVLLFHQFMFTMCERARVLKVTPASKLPVFAHLCFALHFVVFDKLISLLLALEIPLRLFYNNYFLLIFEPFIRMLSALFPSFITRVWNSLLPC
jgi:hypothetical protein